MQLSTIYRTKGLYQGARRISSLRLTIERKIKPPLRFPLAFLLSAVALIAANGILDDSVPAYVFWPDSWLGWMKVGIGAAVLGGLVRHMMFFYWLFFDYGMSIRRALVTFGFFLLGGWAAIDYASDAGMLVVDPLPVADVVVRDMPETRRPPRAMAYGMTGADGLPNTGVVCGDTVNAFVYAADVFIPLVEFRQQFRCHIRPPLPEDKFHPDADATVFSEFPRWLGHLPQTTDFWLIAKGVYAVLGWLIVSLTILTATGLLRRQVES